MSKKNYVLIKNLESKIQNYLDKAKAKGDKNEIQELTFIRLQLGKLNEDFLTKFDFPF